MPLGTFAGWQPAGAGPSCTPPTPTRRWTTPPCPCQDVLAFCRGPGANSPVGAPSLLGAPKPQAPCLPISCPGEPPLAVPRLSLTPSLPESPINPYPPFLPCPRPLLTRWSPIWPQMIAMCSLPWAPRSADTQLSPGLPTDQDMAKANTGRLPEVGLGLTFAL